MTENGSGEGGAGAPDRAADWAPELEELAQRRRMAAAMGGAESVERQHAQGRLTVRERIDALVDQGSFREVGQIAGKGRYENGRLRSLTPASYVAGLAAIDGRPVAVGGEDFTVRGGSSAGGVRRKGGQGGFSEDLALHLKMPLVNLCEGAGGTVTSTRDRGYTNLPGAIGNLKTCVQLLGMVPVVSAVLGSTAGGPAIRAVLSHWSVMVQGTSQLFAAGPALVERSLGHSVEKESLGGPAVAVEAGGAIHDVVPDESAALAMIRQFLSYMPRNVWEAPPSTTPTDPPARREEALAAIIPKNRRHPYDMRRLVRLVVDKDSVMELQRTYGKAVITALARMNGRVVGIIASNPLANAGALDHKAARKQTSFLELCNTFHIPIVFFVDVPGMMIGRDAEMAGTLREGARAIAAKHRATVPMITVIVRKCYGMAGGIAVDDESLKLRVAWPSAEWGSLPLEGGVLTGYRSEIAAASDPKARERELEDELRALSSPFRTAEVFAVEDVIDPRETRPYLCRFLDVAAEAVRTQLGPKTHHAYNL